LYLVWLATMGMLLSIALIWGAWSIWDWSGDEWFAIAALFVLVLAGGLAVNSLGSRAAATDGSRLPSAVLLFLVVALFAAVTSYGIGYARPVVHPVALGLKDGKRLDGVYIGENADEVWVGRIVQSSKDPDHGNKSEGRMVAVPRADITRMAVGYTSSLTDAMKVRPILDAELSQR